MKNLRNLLTAITLMMVLMVSTSSAKTGLLVSDLTSDNPQSCTETTKEDTKTDWGIIITSFTGIIITSFTGIIITDANETPTDCGIILTD